jgi:DNA-directed RNA polymerase I, II, and III subunit RPABC2
MTTENKIPFDDCVKVFSSLENKKVSKMIMTKYEFNLVISQRTVQLSQGHPSFVDVEKNIKSNMDLRKIALEELKQGKIPFIIKRPLPNEKYEFVRIRDLDLSAVKYMIDL